MLREILAIIATILVTVSYVPQIVKGYRTKSLRDVSMWFLCIICLGVAVWIAYGFVARDWTFVIANAFIILLSGSLIVMKLRYG